MQRRLARWLMAAGLSILSAVVVLSAHWLPATSTAPSLELPATIVPTTASYTIYLPHIGRPRPRIVIAAAHIDSALSGEPDEALQLWNLDSVAHSLAGWRLRANGRTASFPITTTVTIPPAGQIWCAKTATAFRQSFGFLPQCEWTESDPAIPNLSGSTPPLTNSGGVLQLLSADGIIVDTLLYGDETATATGWQGAAAQLYSRGSIPVQGQVWRRKIDPLEQRPLDTGRASDWAGDLADLAWGRQVFFPGWTLWQAPPITNEIVEVNEATTTVAVGPEGLYPIIADHIDAAGDTIDLSLYSFEHPELATALAAAAQRGVRVRLLLEGSPTGGINHLQRWCLLQLAEAGVTILYMESRADAPAGYRPRYRFAHAKYAIFDDTFALISTENLSRESMPLPIADGVFVGRRGFALVTDAAPIVTQLSQIFTGDWAPDQFADLRPFDIALDGPPPDFVPTTAPMDLRIDAPFAAPVTVQDSMRMALVTAPENASHPDGTFMELLARAGRGDSIHWMQLYEHKYWGDGTSNVIADPNPRLEMLIAAARRGATVRMLLDSFFDDPNDLRGNQAIADYLHAVAANEGLDIEVRLGNPTGLGIHAKLGLIHIGDEYWSAVGSLNGGEVSHKINREVVLMVDHPGVYDRLLEVFQHDWALVTG